MLRRPAVSGSFYPSEAGEVEAMLDRFIDDAELEFKVSHPKAFVAPHAGYIYSGYVAAYAYKALRDYSYKNKIDTFVVIGPNHYGTSKFATVSLADWETPLGIAENDIEMSKEIASFSSKFSTNENEEAQEHSVEVQIPFLQFLFKNPMFCFICMSNQSLGASKIVCDAVLHAGRKSNRKIMVIASSDFNHYESASVAKVKDGPELDAIEKLDEKKLYSALQETGDTACGFGPISAAIQYAKAEGASKGILLRYRNSGDVTNDYGSVVAYAGIAFE